jgi:hypothetical protein
MGFAPFVPVVPAAGCIIAANMLQMSILKFEEYADKHADK